MKNKDELKELYDPYEVEGWGDLDVVISMRMYLT